MQIYCGTDIIEVERIQNAVENTKFDFCRNLKWFLVAPLIIILIGIVLLCTLGFNLGLDFTGGTNMTIFIDSEGSYILKDEQNNLLAPTFDVNKDMGAIEAKVNDVLKEYFASIGVELIDFKLEFGKTSDGTIVLADEISPDTCRFWDIETHEKLDKDRFRRDLGGVEDAYAEMMKRTGLEK